MPLRIAFSVAWVEVMGNFKIRIQLLKLANDIGIFESPDIPPKIARCHSDNSACCFLETDISVPHIRLDPPRCYVSGTSPLQPTSLYFLPKLSPLTPLSEARSPSLPSTLKSVLRPSPTQPRFPNPSIKIFFSPILRTTIAQVLALLVLRSSSTKLKIDLALISGFDLETVHVSFVHRCRGRIESLHLCRGHTSPHPLRLNLSLVLALPPSVKRPIWTHFN
jgi:hypothetical protein